VVVEPPPEDHVAAVAAFEALGRAGALSTVLDVVMGWLRQEWPAWWRPGDQEAATSRPAHFRPAWPIRCLEGLGLRAGRPDILDRLFFFAGPRSWALRKVPLRCLRHIAPPSSAGAVEEPRAHLLQLLVDLLAAPEPPRRHFAASELAACGELASIRSVLLPLTDRLGDADESVRRAALEALSVLGPLVRPADQDVYLGRLTELLSGPDGEVRAAAARACGPLGAVAGPALLGALADALLGPPPARGAAAEALATLGPAACPHVLPRLAAALRQPPGEGSPCGQALWLLARLGPAAATPEVGDALLVLLGHPDQHVRARVAEAAAGFGPALSACGDLRADLVGLLADPWPWARVAAARAVAAAGLGGADAPLRREARTRLAALTRDRVVVARQAAIDLATLWPAAEALGLLTPLLADPSDAVREAAVRACGRLGPPARAELPGLLARLLDDDMNAPRRAAAEVLAALGPAAAVGPVRAALARLLADEGADERAAAFVLLAGLGPAALVGPVTAALGALFDAPPGAAAYQQAVAAVGRLGALGCRFVRGPGGWSARLPTSPEEAPTC
jgi:HEAT repeat protein